MMVTALLDEELGDQKVPATKADRLETVGTSTVWTKERYGRYQKATSLQQQAEAVGQMWMIETETHHHTAIVGGEMTQIVNLRLQHYQ
jgi:hypothetical protein